MRHAKQKNTTHRRGFTLFYAALVASLLLAIGLAIFDITFKQLLLSSDARESQSAFYAADNGLECALFWDIKHTGLSSPAFGFYGSSLGSGLAGFWRMNDGAGSDAALDSSGTGNTGMLKNMDTNAAWVAGHNGGGLLFDGLDDYVRIEDNPSLSFTNTGLTVAAWVYVPALANAETIVKKNNQWGIILRLNTHNIRALVKTDGIDGYIGTNEIPYTLTPNTWYHIAFTYDGSQLIYYVDGSATGPARTVTGNIVDNSDPVVLGAQYDSSTGALTQLFAGALDDVRVYNRALSDLEMQALVTESPHNVFVAPVKEQSNAVCANEDITDRATGWDPDTGWEPIVGEASATTTFDMSFRDGGCALVSVVKETATTTIVSHGYNTCDLTDPRRVERAIRAQY